MIYKGFSFKKCCSQFGEKHAHIMDVICNRATEQALTELTNEKI